MQRQQLLVRLVDFFIGLAELVLILRVVLRLFNASQGASFVNWVYQTSGTLLAPFRGIFPTEVLHRGYVLDVSALFAVLVYAFIGYLLIELIGFTPSTSKKR